MVAYTERVFHISSALLMAAYSQYRLLYVWPTVIRLARELGMGMAVTLGSATNVRELLEMLDIIDSTRLESLQESWSERVSRSVDYHPGRSGLLVPFLLTILIDSLLHREFGFFFVGCFRRQLFSRDGGSRRGTVLFY